MAAVAGLVPWAESGTMILRRFASPRLAWYCLMSSTPVNSPWAPAAGCSVNYQFNRFCNAYEGLLKMCASAGAVLMIKRHDGSTELWVEQAAAIEDEADSDLMEFDVTRAHRVVNHLVCAGEGELRDREVIDLYADASGNISTTQTLTGVDEVALLYDYSGADSTELTSSGTQKLKEYQTNGGATVNAVGRGDWHVGNRLQVRDKRSGTTVTAVIAKKIVKVERGVLSVAYEVGDHIAAEAANFDANLSGIAEQPRPFTKAQADDYYPLLKGGTRLYSTDDLDDLKTVGTYYVQQSSDVPQNAPGSYVGKVIVSIPHGLTTSAIRAQEYIVYSSGYSWYRKFESNAWSDWWREAPRSTNLAAANRFLASPDGVAGLPSYRQITMNDIPSTYTSSTTVANVLTQTQTQEDSYPVTEVYYYRWGQVVMLRVTFKPVAAVSVGTNMSICTINEGKRPIVQAFGGSGYIQGAITAAGALSGRPRTALTANTTYAFTTTYLLA